MKGQVRDEGHKQNVEKTGGAKRDSGYSHLWWGTKRVRGDSQRWKGTERNVFCLNFSML